MSTGYYDDEMLKALLEIAQQLRKLNESIAGFSHSVPPSERKYIRVKQY